MRMLRVRQRDMSAAQVCVLALGPSIPFVYNRKLYLSQDCSSAFASMTWHVESHAKLVQLKAIPTLLEMTKLDDQLILSNVASALHTPDV